MKRHAMRINEVSTVLHESRTATLDAFGAL